LAIGGHLDSWLLAQEDNMDRTVALEKIRSARVARGISYEDLGQRQVSVIASAARPAGRLPV